MTGWWWLERTSGEAGADVTTMRDYIGFGGTSRPRHVILSEAKDLLFDVGQREARSRFFAGAQNDNLVYYAIVASAIGIRPSSTP